MALAISASCTKQENQKHCWKCTVSLMQNTGTAGYTNLGTSNVVYCDLTSTQIKKVEKDGTYTKTGTSGGYTATIYTTTKCVMQN